jgi:hypothetical protein
MRRHLLLATLLLSACGTGRESEPNNHFTQATDVGRKTRFAGTISSPDDVDIYRLDRTVGTENLSVRVHGVRGIDFVLSIQDSERRELKRVDESAMGGDERLLDLGLATGIYYIVISNKNPKATNTSQEYKLEFTFEPSLGREGEPNDRALQATPLVPGGIMQGHYFPSRNLLAEENGFREEDWFRINVAQEGMFLLNIDVSEVPKVDAVLEIYGPNAYKIKEIDATGVGGPEVLRGFGIRGPVHYYLRLRAKKQTAWNSDIPYQILSELLPYRGTTEFEANDQRLEATPLEGSRITGRIGSAGDTDWYRIRVAEDQQLLSARLGGVAGLDLRLTLTDEIGRTLLEVDNQMAERPETLTPTGVQRGDYYLVVSEKTGMAFDARADYELTVAVSPFQAGLEFELNNSSATAQRIELEQKIDGFFAPRGDEDWYEFNVYQPAEIIAEISGVLNVHAEAVLFNQEGVEVTRAQGTGPGEAITVITALEAGTYSLQLAPTDPSHNNIRDKYTLRVRAR